MSGNSVEGGYSSDLTRFLESENLSHDDLLTVVTLMALFLWPLFLVLARRLEGDETSDSSLGQYFCGKCANVSVLMATSAPEHSEAILIVDRKGYKTVKHLRDYGTQPECGLRLVRLATTRRKVISYFVRYGAGINLQGSDGLFALIAASSTGNTKFLFDNAQLDATTISLLLDHGANINMVNDGISALITASLNGRVKTVQSLLDHGAGVNLQNTPSRSALLIASDSVIRQLLLKHGAEVDMLTEGSSVLVLASAIGHTEVVKHLLNSGTQDGNSALVVASGKGHAETVQILLDHGAEVNLENALGCSALMLASLNGHSTVCELLLKHGAEAASALVFVSAKGHSEMVELLLNGGAQVNTQYKDGTSALMLASHQGHIKTVKLLLDRGANINMLNLHGCSALMLACHEGHSETARVLISHGADVACVMASTDMIKFLLDHVKTWDISTLTCGSSDISVEIMLNAMLAVASCVGLTDMVKLLLDHGTADANAITIDDSQHDQYECSVLMLASCNGHAEVVRTLVNAGANVNWHNQHGTALMVTCFTQCVTTHLKSASKKFIQDRTEVIDLLCSNGAEVNKSFDGKTPLQVSILCGHTETTRQLVNHGAEINDKADDWSPLTIAAMAGQVDIAKYLIECGAQVKSKDIVFCSIYMQHTEKVKFHHDTITNLAGTEDPDFSESVRSALDYITAPRYVERAKMVELLLDSLGSVPSDTLLEVCARGHTETVKIMLDYGAEVNLQDVRTGMSALMGACFGGHPEVVKLLLDRGAEVDALDSKGNSPLILTCLMEFAGNGVAALRRRSEAEYVEVVKILLDYSAKVDIRNNKGVSAQMAACSAGNIDILRLLLNHGTQIDPKGIEIARQRNHVEVVKLLKSTRSCAPNEPHLQENITYLEQMRKEIKDQFKKFEEQQNKMFSMMEAMRSTGISIDHSCLTKHPGFSVSSGKDKTLELPTVFRELLPLASEWEAIGCLLELPEGRLEETRADQDRARDRLHSMLKEWLKTIDPPPSWEHLADAVKQLNPEKGKAIRDKYCNHSFMPLFP
jgi:serine/threonine-protein phosphatase 6 regulatory ankyrin repeat subunit B